MPSLKDDVIIRASALKKSYGSIQAVKGVDFEIGRGEIFGLIGPDGAGKTTIFNILSGVREYDGGLVEILGTTPSEARTHVGYLTQQFSLYADLTVDENLRYIAGLRNVEEADFQERSNRYLTLTNMQRFRERWAGKLSGGMKQKLALCCALLSHPQVLLLDEPTSAVDPVSRREFWDILGMLAAENITIVVATPYLDEAERCSRISLIYEGLLHEVGSPREIKARMGGHRLEVWLPNLSVAKQKLDESSKRANSTIEDVQTFGARLDVLVKNLDAGQRELVHALSRAGTLAKEIRQADVTLENVFVTRLRQRGREANFIRFPRFKLPMKDTGATLIGAKNLYKSFGPFHAVQNVNLDVRHGEIYGLLGANGAGKTTTIKMLCGLMQPTTGTITIGGLPSDNVHASQLRRRIGYMSQKFTLYDDLSILENLKLYCGVYGIPREQRPHKIDWAMQVSGLEGQEHLLVKQLPQGWKQRVSFGASVMHEPEILFLDEPTSGVDPVARRQFWQQIEEVAHHGTAILVSTHYLEEAEHCHRVGFMVDGRVVTEGSPEEIKLSQPGKLYELVVNNLPKTMTLLRARLAHWKVSMFGERLHLVLEHPNFERRNIQAYLESNGIQIQLFESIPFSLEDAFIGIVERERIRDADDG